MTNDNRVPAGVPTGGEFATGAKAENADLSPVTWRLGRGRKMAIHDDGRQFVQSGPHTWVFVGSYENGNMHRDGGPALNHPTIVGWYRNGVPSRPLAEGPALVEADGRCHYYLDGKEDLAPEEDMVRHGVHMDWEGRLWLSAAVHDFKGFREQFALADPDNPWA